MSADHALLCSTRVPIQTKFRERCVVRSRRMAVETELVFGSCGSGIGTGSRECAADEGEKRKGLEGVSEREGDVRILHPSSLPFSSLVSSFLPPLSGSDETGKPDAGPCTHILHGRRGHRAPCRSMASIRRQFRRRGREVHNTSVKHILITYLLQISSVSKFPLLLTHIVAHLVTDAFTWWITGHGHGVLRVSCKHRQP